MQTMPMERRTRRSYQPQEALSFQLEHVREKAGIEALVLATMDGLSIAHSGEDELCLELAALAPFLCEAANENDGRARATRIRELQHGGLTLVLISYADELDAQLDEWLDHTSAGIHRILSD